MNLKIKGSKQSWNRSSEDWILFNWDVYSCDTEMSDCCRDEAIWLCKQKYNWQNHKDLSRSRENLECILFAAHSAHSETVRGRMYIGTLKGCRCHSRDRFIPHCWNWKVRLKLLDCPGSCGGEGFQCSMSNCCSSWKFWRTLLKAYREDG